MSAAAATSPLAPPSPSDPVLAKAVAKIKARVLPIFIILFIANYIDRVNIGFVKSHLKTDLGIDVAAFGLGAGLFFVGYALFEVPSNILLQKTGARIWLTRITISWGFVAAMMAFIQNETHFYILRFLLGVAEAGFFPGVIYYFTRWLPNAERGKAIALFLSGSAIASIVSGPLTGALLKLEGFGLHGWQWMFLIEGLASVMMGALVWFGLDSLPHDAKWLKREEQDAIVNTIADEQKAREAAQPVKPSLFKMLSDPQIVLFCGIYFAIQLTIYAATFWLPSIIKKMGGDTFSDFKIGLFNSIPWTIAIVAMYIMAAGATRWKFQQAWVALALLIAAFGMFMSTTGGPVFAFVAICFAAIGFKAASATFGWLEKNTGSIQGGLYGLAIASVIAAALVFFARTQPKPKLA